jgi:hypothetical protein
MDFDNEDLGKQSAMQVIAYWGKKGLSDRSIAAKLGMTYTDFLAKIERVQPLRLALDAARAEFEAERVEMKDAIMNDPETSNGLRYKIVREDLKTLEAWAPATRAVKVQVEAAGTVLSFESLTEEEMEQIKSASQGAGTNDDTEES